MAPRAKAMSHQSSHQFSETLQAWPPGQERSVRVPFPSSWRALLLGKQATPFLSADSVP